MYGTYVSEKPRPSYGLFQFTLNHPEMNLSQIFILKCGKPETVSIMLHILKSHFFVLIKFYPH